MRLKATVVTLVAVLTMIAAVTATAAPRVSDARTHFHSCHNANFSYFRVKKVSCRRALAVIDRYFRDQTPTGWSCRPGRCASGSRVIRYHRFD